jgi:thioesterase domain-containing protein/acyl carrier protein
MVPASFTALPSLPLTPNGKLDRRALPAPEHGLAETELDEPRNYVEAQLIPIWEELLGTGGIGATQSFFDLGGNSLLALRLFTRVNRRLGCDLPVATLFGVATVRHMADAILEQKRGDAAPPGSVVPLQPHGSLPPLFAVHAADRNVMGYVSMVRHLGMEQPVYGVRDVGDDMSRPLAVIAAEHVAAVRAVQPGGPYYLAGWSFGGFVAFEMALQLESQGETVAFVGLLDSMSPVLAQEWRWDRGAELVVALGREVAARMRRPFSMQAAEVEGLDPDGQLRRVVEALHAQGAAPAGFDAAALGRHVETVQVRTRSLDGYVPGRFGGTLTLFRATDLAEHHDEFFSAYTGEEQRTLGWCRHAERVEVHPVPGSHVTIAAEPHVGVFAAALRESLAAARGRAAEQP